MPGQDGGLQGAVGKSAKRGNVFETCDLRD
jgi:hypothetical protein